jgi:hypothetical protein
MTNHRLAIAAALLPMLLAAGAAGAQSRAAQTLNFEFGVDAKDIDTSGSTSNGTLGLKGAATIPLGRYFAIAASAGYSKSQVRTRDSLADESGSNTGIASCSFKGNQGGITLFARRPTLGKVGVSYGVNQLSSECGDSSVFVTSGDDSLDAKNYRIFAEYYLYDFTLAASQTATDLDHGDKLDSTSITASWYPLDSLRISASAGSDLYERDTYGIMLEHQPDFLGDGLGVYLGYARTDQSPSTRTVTFGFAYYFGVRADLKTRDRQYR